MQAKHRIFGVLRFCGPDRATNAPLCGVELYEPIGDGSGKFGENEYFRCEPGHALFVEQKRVRLFGNVTIRTKDEWAEIVVAATKKGKSAVSRVVDELKLRVRAEDPFAPMVLGKLYCSQTWPPPVFGSYTGNFSGMRLGNMSSATMTLPQSITRRLLTTAVWMGRIVWRCSSWVRKRVDLLTSLASVTWRRLST